MMEYEWGSTATDFPVTRFLAGFYRITAPGAYGNVKRSRGPEHKGKWLADIHNNAGDLIQYAGIWNTKKEGIDEVQHILQRYKEA